MKSQQECLETSYILQEYDKLFNCKSLGFYNCCETTSVILYQNDTKQVFNLFTIFVMEERIDFQEENRYLTHRRIKISKNYAMGIHRTVQPAQAARKLVEELGESRAGKRVDIGEGLLETGTLEAVPKVFVQQNSTKEITLNKVLKNNFKNGSYILEFFDVDKRIRTFFNQEEFQKMTRELYHVLPIDLMSVSDRIGNFIVQFPSINARISYTTDERETMLHYHVKLDERIGKTKNFQLQSELRYDDNVVGFGVSPCDGIETKVSFSVGDASQICCSTLIDSDNQLILARQETSFVRQMNLQMNWNMQYGDTRFLYGDNQEIIDTVEVSSAEKIHIPQPVIRYRENWMLQRAYHQRAEELYNRKEFRRYGEQADRKRAVSDVIALMNLGSGGKVYLWDPYLSVEDLLATWYYTGTYHVPLKAITSGELAKKQNTGVPEWMKRQQEYIEKRSNHYGINVELRCQWKHYGYGFHDRFLMVLSPDRENKVWSLGTSINSLGMKHHIIQSVEHPQMIIDTFEKLWEALSAEECLVWKKE